MLYLAYLKFELSSSLSVASFPKQSTSLSDSGSEEHLSLFGYKIKNVLKNLSNEKKNYISGR